MLPSVNGDLKMKLTIYFSKTSFPLLDGLVVLILNLLQWQLEPELSQDLRKLQLKSWEKPEGSDNFILVLETKKCSLLKNVLTVKQSLF